MHTAKPFVQPKPNADHLLPSDASQRLNLGDPEAKTQFRGFATNNTHPQLESCCWPYEWHPIECYFLSSLHNPSNGANRITQRKLRLHTPN